MDKYTQLSLENCHQIKALLDAGHSQAGIARFLGVDLSTINRNFAQNIANKGM